MTIFDVVDTIKTALQSVFSKVYVLDTLPAEVTVPSAYIHEVTIEAVTPFYQGGAERATIVFTLIANTVETIQSTHPQVLQALYGLETIIISNISVRFLSKEEGTQFFAAEYTIAVEYFSQ